MSDYEGKIRLSVQGLDQIQAADEALSSAANNVDRLANTKIQLRVAGADSLSKLASQMSAIETRALDLASAVSRIGEGAATIKFSARLDRQSLNRELNLVSRQFQRRNWRLNVNDTSVKTARLQAEKLGEELQRIVSKKYVINVDYRYDNPPRGGRSGGRPPVPPRGPTGPGGASPEDIARRAGEAMASGLTAKLYSDAVAGARSSAARQGLIERFEQRVQRPQSPGGINQSLARRYLNELGGIAPKGASPQELKAEVVRLLRTVDQSVIDNLTSRIKELKLSLQMPRNMRLPARGLPNFSELLERMAAQTTRPAEAGRMLQMLPSRAITTDLAGLASRQSSKYLWPSMIPQGGDELFNEIKKLFTNYFKAQNPSNLWAGPKRKPYALQEIMAWEPWMATPRSQRGQRLLPRAGESSRAQRITGFSSLQTSYDLEIAKRNISAFAKEVFKARKQIALPAAGAGRAVTPASLNAQVVPVRVRDITSLAQIGSARPMLPGIISGATPYQEPNWNELMERMAAVTRNPAAASRRLRALPRQMVTTDLAGLATDQAAGMFGRADPLGAQIRELSRQAGLASSPLDQISDALRNASSSASAFIARLQAAFARPPGGGGAGGGFGGSGGGGFQPFGLLPPAGPTPRPFRRTTRRPDSATVDASQFASGALYAGLTQTSVDERRRGQFADVLDNYVRAVADGEQAQRSLNADIERTAQAIQSARRAYVEAGATQALTTDQVRATRSGIIRERRANFTIDQRRTADQIQALEEQRAPISIFRNYGQLQNLYGQLPITQRRGALRNLREARNGAARSVASEVLIGGAFPLLFGQGPATSFGGAVGGAASLFGPGAGFAGGLVGSAVGMQIDTLFTNLGNLASALKSPNDAIAALEASGFRVGDSLKFQVEQLQAVGRAYDAQTLVLQEVEKRLGVGAAQELNALNAEQKKLQDQWSSIAGTIQSELVPALTLLTQGINGVLWVARQAAPFAKDFAGNTAQTAGRTVGGPISFAVPVLQALSSQIPGLSPIRDTANAVLSRSRGAGAPARTPPSPQEAFAAETTRIQESRRIADQIQSAYREAFNLQRQAYDLQREGADINREIADYSYRKQREIFDLRQQVAEKEIENNRAAAQNSIERGDLGARQTFAAAVGFEQQLLSNVRETVRTRKEGEADIEQSRRKLELTMSRLNRDVEDYKRTNAREIEDIERRKLSYVRSVEDYKMRVADYVRDRAREAADLMRQAMSQGEVGGTGGGATGNATYTPVSPLRQIPYLSQIDKAAKEANVDPRLFAGLVQQESAFNPSARSSSGAIGLAQLMPGTARELGVDPLNIQENLRGGAKYLRQMIDRFGLEGGLRAYNQGPGAQQRTPGGNSRESREYPGKVLANARALGFNPATAAAPATMGGVARLPGSISGRLDASGQNGADMPVGPNNEIRSYHSGVVRQIGQAGRNGNFAVIEFIDDLGNRLEATYSHMAAIVKVGQQVTGGQVLGRYDASGRTSGPHNSIDINSPGTNGALQRNAETAAARRSADILVTGRVQGSSALQAAAAGQISNVPRPKFNPVPTGPTPSAAPLNADRMAVLTRATGNEKDAQRILENEIKLRQKGVSLGQIEQILQSNQLPQLQQQGEALKDQLKVRLQNLTLSDQDAAIVDARAEATARIAQLEKDRAKALDQVRKQYNGDAQLIKQVNTQSADAIAIAKGEEKQRIENLQVANQIQNSDRVRTEILNLQEGLAAEQAQAAALQRGELQASNVELLKASTLYKEASEAQQRKWIALAGETEELRKQNEFRRRYAESEREIGSTGSGFRAGFIGAPARAFENAMREFDGDIGKATDLANQVKRLEDQQLVWSNLEKSIVDVSDAISGSLTNGLLDIISGAREIEDVGRDMLNGIARTFADSAQQQLTALMQRQLAGVLGGPQGPLVKALGGGGGEVLGAASAAASGSLWGLNGAAIALGATMQTVAAQMALSGAMGGVGSAFSSSAPSLLGSAMPNLLPGFSPTFTFGGFLAEGGTTRPNEGYVVGEKEPEFFFPGRVGRVVPKSDMEKAAALQSDSATNATIDMRYTVVEERGERYVTEDQFRKGLAETQRKTQAMTYAKMRTSKDVRDYVNI